MDVEGGTLLDRGMYRAIEGVDRGYGEGGYRLVEVETEGRQWPYPCREGS